MGQILQPPGNSCRPRGPSCVLSPQPVEPRLGQREPASALLLPYSDTPRPLGPEPSAPLLKSKLVIHSGALSRPAPRPLSTVAPCYLWQRTPPDRALRAGVSGSGRRCYSPLVSSPLGSCPGCPGPPACVIASVSSQTGRQDCGEQVKSRSLAQRPRDPCWQTPKVTRLKGPLRARGGARPRAGRR